MVKVIMHGCNGHMGQVITQLVEKDPEIEIVAGIDLNDCRDNGYPVFTDIWTCDVQADAVIDFCTAKATDTLLEYCEKRQIPVVLCTTGLTDEQIKKVEETSKHVAVLKSANMSLGINLLMKLVKEAAQTLAAAGFDMEIVEKHHRLKVDAPSGTALALADSLNEGLDNAYHYTFDRSQRREQRDDKEIGISAVRGGTIVGVFFGCRQNRFRCLLIVDNFPLPAYQLTALHAHRTDFRKFFINICVRFHTDDHSYPHMFPPVFLRYTFLFSHEDTASQLPTLPMPVLRILRLPEAARE